MSRLKPHHYDLLRRIIAAQLIPLTEVDGRMIRPLFAGGLLQIEGGHVKATMAGRTALAAVARGSSSDHHSARLSAGQEDLLRLIIRQPGIASDEVDKRTSRALRVRGLIRETDGRLFAASEAAAALPARHLIPAKSKRGRRPRSHPRAEAILNTVELLESALPPEAEVLAGTIMCAAVDVTDAFRKYARKLAKAQDQEPQAP